MYILKILILMIEFLGFGMVLRRFVGLPMAVSPPVVASLIILFLYVTNFFVSLKPMSMLIHISGVFAFLYFASIKIKNNKKHPLDKQSIIVFIGVLLTFALLFILNRNGEFRSWDEFSHWGAIIRATYEANTFLIIPNPLYCQDYPPGTAIFSYHILSMLGFTEGNAYFSFSVLLLCFAAPIVSTGINKNLAIGVGVFMLIFYLTIALGNGWSSVLIDHVLSLAFAGSIVSYFVMPKDVRSLIFIPFTLAALVLFKHVGSSLATLAACICLVDWLIIRLTKEHNIIPHFRLSLFSYKDILWVLALFLIPFLISVSWKSYVSRYGLLQGWGSMSIMDYIKHSYSCCSTNREINVTGKFFATFFDLNTPLTQATSLGGFLKDALDRVSLFNLIFHSSKLTVGKVMLLLCLLGFITSFCFSSAQRRLRFTILNIELTLGAILYSASLLLAYIYGFSDYEAGILISFQRYHNVFLLGWSLILLYVLLELGKELSTKKKRFFLPLTILIILAFSYLAFLSFTKGVSAYIQKGALPATEERVTIKKFVQKFKPYIPKDAHVYISWYGSNGWEFWMIKYELLPQMTNTQCFSLGPKLNSADLWTCPFKPSMFSGYDYLLIGKGLQVLHNTYGTLFSNLPPNIDAGLLEIKNTTHGISLIYVPESKS